MELRTHWGAESGTWGCSSDVTEVKGPLIGVMKFWSPTGLALHFLGEGQRWAGGSVGQVRWWLVRVSKLLGSEREPFQGNIFRICSWRVEGKSLIF